MAEINKLSAGKCSTSCAATMHSKYRNSCGATRKPSRRRVACAVRTNNGSIIGLSRDR